MEGGSTSSPTTKELRIAVLGTKEHEGQMCGGAFENLGVNLMYLDPKNPVCPSNFAPDVVLLSREWNVDIRQAAIAARRRNIAVVYLVDGVIEWDYVWHNWGFVKPEGTVLQPAIASDLCVVGQHQARVFSAFGLAEKIHVVGLPRLDGLKRRRVIDRDLPRRIVVATAKTFGLNTAQKVYVRAALRDLKAWFDRHPGIFPVWRVSGELAEELGVVASTENRIENVLETASGVISFTSTVLLEAMRIGVPTAQIDYRAVPQYVQTAWEIRNPEQIESVVQELLYPPAEKLAYQEICLNDELEPGNASERLAEVIRRAVESPPHLEDGLSSRVHGVLDYRQVNSHLSTFSVAPISRLQYELDATYKLWERDVQRLKAREAALAKVRADPVVRALLALGWLPGLRRLARLIRSLWATP